MTALPGTIEPKAFETIDVELLATVDGGLIQPAANYAAGWAARFGQKVASGTFDWNRAVDNGNRYATPGGIAGATVGAGVGALGLNPVTVGGGMAGGGLIGTGLGWAGGFLYDANEQMNGR